MTSAKFHLNNCSYSSLLINFPSFPRRRESTVNLVFSHFRTVDSRLRGNDGEESGNDGEESGNDITDIKGFYNFLQSYSLISINLIFLLSSAFATATAFHIVVGNTALNFFNGFFHCSESV